MRPDQREVPTEMIPIVQNITINGGALEPKPGAVTLRDLAAVLIEIKLLLEQIVPLVQGKSP